jgi:high-affinity Fe2+/Pb2+ permease
MIDMPDLSSIPVVVLVTALVEAVKRAGLPTKYAGLAAVAIGILLTFLVAAAEGALGEQNTRISTWLLSGIVTGLAASGLYSQARVLTRPAPPIEPSGEPEKPTAPPTA